MRHLFILLGGLSLAVSVQANDFTYYNPTNTASDSGATRGHELYNTIGCPGQGILETGCSVSPAPAKAPAKVETAVAVPPAAPVNVAPAPVVAVAQPAAESVVEKSAPMVQLGNSGFACPIFIKPAVVAQQNPWLR